MNRLLLALAFIFANGCVTEGYQENYLVVDGLAIVGVYGADISAYTPQAVSDLLTVVENAVNARFDRHEQLDIRALIEATGLEVHVYPYERMSVAGAYTAGDNRIMLSASLDTESPSTVCQQAYYVLGHELLHFVDRHYVGNTQGGHGPELFFWSCTEHRCYQVTAEYDIWMHYAHVCGYDATLGSH